MVDMKPARRSNASAMSETKAEQKKILAPLRSALRTVYDKMSYDQASRILGSLPPHRIRRGLSAAVASPNYIDMTELIVGANMTPNQGAALCGLYKIPNPKTTKTSITLDEEDSDPRLIYAIKVATGMSGNYPADFRESLTRAIQSVVIGLEGQFQVEAAGGSVKRRVHLR